MPLILPVTLNNCLALAGLPNGTNAAMSALIALKQPALEFAVDPVILANSTTNAGLQALLTLAVTEIISGEYVTSLARVQLSATLFKVSTLELENRPANDLSKIGAALTAQGAARLAPFLQAPKAMVQYAYAGQPLIDVSPVLQSEGTGLGTPGAIGVVGPPADPDFDRQLGVDGQDEPPGSDLFLGFNAGGFGGFDL
jgi:hypothetical protein